MIPLVTPSAASIIVSYFPGRAAPPSSPGMLPEHPGAPSSSSATLDRALSSSLGAALEPLLPAIVSTDTVQAPDRRSSSFVARRERRDTPDLLLPDRRGTRPVVPPSPRAARTLGVSAHLPATTHEPHHRRSCCAVSVLVDTVPHYSAVYLPATVKGCGDIGPRPSELRGAMHMLLVTV